MGNGIRIIFWYLEVVFEVNCMKLWEDSVDINIVVGFFNLYRGVLKM